MYIIQFATRQYQFTDKQYAEVFARTWGEQVKYLSLCGDPNCHCESLCKSFHFVASKPAPTILGHEQEDYQLNN